MHYAPYRFLMPTGVAPTSTSMETDSEEPSVDYTPGTPLVDDGWSTIPPLEDFPEDEEEEELFSQDIGGGLSVAVFGGEIFCESTVQILCFSFQEQFFPFHV